MSIGQLLCQTKTSFPIGSRLTAWATFSEMQVVDAPVSIRAGKAVILITCKINAEQDSRLKLNEDR